MRSLVRNLCQALTATPLIMSADVSAETLAPLAEMPDTIETSYAFVRCAAFNLANFEWAGSDRLGPDTSDRIERSVEALMLVAVLVRMERNGGTEETVAEITNRDARNIADLYLARFERTYAKTGEAWLGDPVWVSDLEHCTALEANLEAPGQR